jgi:hypothetical protein
MDNEGQYRTIKDGDEYMANILKDDNLTRIAEGVKPDAKRRVVLPSVLVREDIIYHIYTNAVGQVVLDPQVTIPASEAWVFQNPEILASIKRGIKDIKNGRVSRVNLDSL